MWTYSIHICQLIQRCDQVIKHDFQNFQYYHLIKITFVETTWTPVLSKTIEGKQDKPVKANVPPSTAQRRVRKWRKLRRSSLIVTVIGDKSYRKYTAA